MATDAVPTVEVREASASLADASPAAATSAPGLLASIQGLSSPPTLPAAVLRGPGGGIADFSSPRAQHSPPAAAAGPAPQPVAWRGPPQEGVFGGAAAATPQPAAAASETDVVVISDRKVRLPQPSEPEPSFYRLCRQWVQNDPDLLPPDEPPPKVAPTLPTPASAFPEPPQQEPLPAGAEQDPDALLQYHQAHWRAAGRHMREKQAADSLPHAARLQALLSSGGAGAGSA